MAILLSIFVVAGVVAVLGYPLLRPEVQPMGDPFGPAAQIRDLEERKLQIYAAIRELGFDYRSDKLLDADYEEEVELLKRQAIEVVRQLDELSQDTPRGPEELEAEIAAVRAGFEASGKPLPAGDGKNVAVFCTQCGVPAADEDHFCAACGTPLRRSP